MSDDFLDHALVFARDCGCLLAATIASEPAELIRFLEEYRERSVQTWPRERVQTASWSCATCEDGAA